MNSSITYKQWIRLGKSNGWIFSRPNYKQWSALGKSCGWLPKSKTENSAETLTALRLKRRVKQPKHANHKLIRNARRLCNTTIIHYKSKPNDWDNLFTGDAPDDAFYDGRVLYIGSRSSRQLSGIWHELCHIMIADLKKKRWEFNYKSNQDEEDLACQIEFWLGFVSGYYSYEKLCAYIIDFGWTPKVGDGIRFHKNPVKAFNPNDVESFIVRCRDSAIGVPLAKKVARSLNAFPKKAIARKIANL